MPVWLSTWDVAKKAGVTPERVRQWVREGKLDCVLDDDRRLFREEDVEVFLQALAQKRAAG